MNMTKEVTSKRENLIAALRRITFDCKNPLSVILSGKTQLNTDLFPFTSDCGGYCMILVAPDDEAVFYAAADGYNKLCECVAQNIGQSFTLMELPEKGGFIALAALNDDSAADRLKLIKKLSAVGRGIKNLFFSTATLVVSPCFHELSDAAEMVYNLILDSGYRVIFGYNSIIDAGSLNKRKGIIPDEYFSLYLGFYNYLRLGEYEKVLYNLSQMKKLVTEHFTPDVFKLAYIGMMQNFSESSGDLLSVANPENASFTVDRAFDEIRNLVENYFERTYQGQSHAEDLRRKVLSIVESEYSDSELTVTMLADRLHISASYLSRYFKNRMGITLFSYMDEIRISRAKQLLANSDYPIKEIVKLVGYNDVNNFNRKFKSKTGNTPTAFRKDSRKDIL